MANALNCLQAGSYNLITLPLELHLQFALE